MISTGISFVASRRLITYTHLSQIEPSEHNVFSRMVPPAPSRPFRVPIGALENTATKSPRIERGGIGGINRQGPNISLRRAAALGVAFLNGSGESHDPGKNPECQSTYRVLSKLHLIHNPIAAPCDTEVALQAVVEMAYFTRRSEICLARVATRMCPRSGPLTGGNSRMIPHDFPKALEEHPNCPEAEK